MLACVGPDFAVTRAGEGVFRDMSRIPAHAGKSAAVGGLSGRQRPGAPAEGSA